MIILDVLEILAVVSLTTMNWSLATKLANSRKDLAHEKELQRKNSWHASWQREMTYYAADEFKARILESAADAWDSTDEKVNLTQLARDKYKLGGPSMPAIWLRHQAAEIRRKRDDEPIYNFKGERLN